MADVRDNRDERRFEIVEDAGVAVLDYRRRGDRLVLVHTGVPEELEGNGYGGRLVAAAIEAARHEGLTVVPECPYARSWIEKHPDRVQGVTVDLVGA